MKRVSSSLTSLGLYSLSAVACVPSTSLNSSLSQIQSLAKQAEANGARYCAPRELALAQAYLEFAKEDLKSGSLKSARRHMERAKLNAEVADLQSPKEICAIVDEPTNLPEEPISPQKQGEEKSQVECVNSSAQDGAEKCAPELALIHVSDCEVTFVEELHFDKETLTIDQSSETALNALLELFLQNPEMILSMEGSNYAENTSEIPAKRQGEIVKQWLVMRGIDPKQIIAHGRASRTDARPELGSGPLITHGALRFLRKRTSQKECSADSNEAKGRND